jgi:hypothetical protein
MAKKLTGFGKASFASIGHLGGYRQTTVTGLDYVLKRLNEEILGIENRSAKGLVESAVLIRNATENEAPLTPLDTGNLRASWFVVSSEGTQPDRLGYSGNFKKNPRTGVKAKDMQAQHSTMVGAAKATVGALAKKGPIVIMGYSANYALFVHEMELAHPGVEWKREGSGGKWLEAAFKRNRNKIIDTVKKNATVK